MGFAEVFVNLLKMDTAEQKLKELNKNINLQIVGDTRIRANISSLAKIYVMDENEQITLLGDLWKKDTVLLVFLRHFACAACRAHVRQILENKESLESKGVKIYFIGNGTPYFMRGFKEHFNLQEAKIFTDPSLKSFDAAGFKRGFWIDPGNMHTRPEFITQAIFHTLKKTGSGNVWQLGGILAIQAGGKITYQYTSQTMDDHPPNKDIVVA